MCHDDCDLASKGYHIIGLCSPRLIRSPAFLDGEYATSCRIPHRVGDEGESYQAQPHRPLTPPYVPVGIRRFLQVLNAGNSPLGQTSLFSQTIPDSFLRGLGVKQTNATTLFPKDLSTSSAMLGRQVPEEIGLYRWPVCIARRLDIPNICPHRTLMRANIVYYKFRVPM